MYRTESIDQFITDCKELGATDFLEEVTDSPESFWRNRVYAIGSNETSLMGMWNIEKGYGDVFPVPIKRFSKSRRKFRKFKV